jgi:hypothetical protein
MEVLELKSNGGSALTSSTTVYAICWFKRRFCSTANILRAPRRAFDLPIMLAANSEEKISIAMGLLEVKTNQGKATKACGLLHLWYELCLQLSEGGQVVSVYPQARRLRGK